MLNCYFPGVKEVISFHLRHINEKNPSRISTTTSKIKTQINEMLVHCFNLQLARGRMQSSDWPVRLPIRIKHVLNIAFIQSPTSKHFCLRTKDFILCSLFKFYLLGSVEPNTCDISLMLASC